MTENRARVLLILSENTLARARVLAGKATATLRLPVSLQIILRALIEDGLKRQNDPTLLASIEAHAHAVRRTRRLARTTASGTPASRSADGRARRRP